MHSAELSWQNAVVLYHALYAYMSSVAKVIVLLLMMCHCVHACFVRNMSQSMGPLCGALKFVSDPLEPPCLVGAVLVYPDQKLGTTLVGAMMVCLFYCFQWHCVEACVGMSVAASAVHMAIYVPSCAAAIILSI